MERCDDVVYCLIECCWENVAENLSDVDTNVFGPSTIESGAVSSDGYQRRVFDVVDQHFPSTVVFVQLLLGVVDLEVKIVEHARHFNQRRIWK